MKKTIIGLKLSIFYLILTSLICCEKQYKDDFEVFMNDSIIYIRSNPPKVIDINNSAPNTSYIYIRDNGLYHINILYSLDIDQNGIDDLVFEGYYNENEDSKPYFTTLNLRIARDSVRILVNGTDVYSDTVVLNRNTCINIYHLNLADYLFIQTKDRFYKSFQFSNNFYLGFVIDNRYGWIRLNADSTKMNLSIIDWAIHKREFGTIYPGQTE